MSKFERKRKGDGPGISTASLPDIVFMLLFFFMVSTVMREVTLKVQLTVPEATELDKLEKKSLVSYIYAGKPNRQYRAKYGSEPRLQLNDQFASPSAIGEYIVQEREAMKETDRPKMFVSIKADQDIEMRIITDVKQELRKANALKINYSARKRADDL